MFSCEYWEDIARCPECARKPPPTDAERRAYIDGLIAMRTVTYELDRAFLDWIGRRASEAGRRARDRVFDSIVKALEERGA